ncbi:hypothetical protein B296_00037308 [Ensete ventricosum]|uniref:Uncharacterized protein n=1 Tax=Ensete ventricosum TaxID=4639 RepID=A0A426YYZ6_ENSVE|nr:hypothetical protein B296_00037308 [Ensete ventricosum]
MVTIRCYDPTAWIEALTGARYLLDDGRDDGLAPKPSFSSRLLAVGAPGRASSGEISLPVLLIPW